MIILRYIAITLDIVFLCIIGFFVKDLRWEEVEHRPSLIGFWWMIMTLVLNVILIGLL